METSTFVPDTIAVPEDEKPKKQSGKSNSVKSSSSKTHSRPIHNEHHDNMRGFDPASEDDTDDNGMKRYMKNNDEEGWI